MTGHLQSTKDDARAVASGQDFRRQETADNLNVQPNIVSEQDKNFSTARAKLALVGWALHTIDGGNGLAAYWVSRWGQSRTLPNRQALDKFIRQVGCQP